MSKDKIERLRKILAEQLVLYEEFTAKEKSGEVDSSYIYDTACDWFNDLNRSDFVEILEILKDKEND